MKKELKIRAKLLRKQGYSFKEIGLKLNVSKSTASLWTRGEHLSSGAINRIRSLQIDGGLKGVLTKRNNYNKLRQNISDNCTVLNNKNKYSSDDYKIFLALLYWGEGSKSGSRLVFTNSDELMIKTYLSLLRRSFVIDNKKFRVCLHLHDYHPREAMLYFWSKLTAIPKNQFYVYNKPHTGKNRKINYKGCLSIRYGDSRILKEVFIIISRIVQII